MKITKIKVNIGRTINLGNYESARIDLGAEADIEERDQDPLDMDLDFLHERILKKIHGKLDRKEY